MNFFFLIFEMTCSDYWTCNWLFCVFCFSPFLDECFRQSPFNSRSKSSSPAEAGSSAKAAFHGKKHAHQSDRNCNFFFFVTIVHIFCVFLPQSYKPERVSQYFKGSIHPKAP